MPDEAQQDTLVILKPDSFWRGLDQQVETRLHALGLKVVAECKLANGQNLPLEKWKEFYFPSIGNKPPIWEGTSKYMAHGPVKPIRLRGPGVIQKVRQAIGATYRKQFQQPGDDQFLFNMIHASDSEQSFAREVQFFPKLIAAA